MFRTLTTTSLALIFALSGPLAAQETEAEAPAEAQEETTPGSDLSLGTPVGDPVPGQPYVREEHTDWSLRCVKAEEGPEPCQLYQLLLDEDGNPVAEMGMFRLPEGNEAVAGANFVAPMETLLTAGVRISVDGGQARAYPFTFCSGRPFSPLLSSGCLARIGFTQAMVDQFRRGNAATITIVPALAPDQEVVLNLSLSGFTAGYGATENTAPAEAE